MIYFDNAATTLVLPEVAELVMKYMTVQYGNTSSLHRMGLDAERALKNARGLTAKHLGCQPEQLVFTSGGTEGNNWVIQRLLEGTPGHCILTAIEHPSVLEPFKALATKGWSLTILPVNAQGVVSPEAVVAALKPDTKLISIMLVNNEIGAIQPVEAIARAVRAAGYKGAIHTDATQALGKLRVRPQHLGVDYLTASAHKFHGPKGVGLLYQRVPKSLKPLFYGGGHEGQQRSGTHNLPGIVGLAKALAISDAGLDAKWQHVQGLRAQILAGLEGTEGLKMISGTVGALQDSRVASEALFVPHILSIAVRHAKSEVLLHILEQAGIMVSSGSACSSTKKSTLSHVIAAIGVDKDYQDGVIRISMSQLNTQDEVQCLIQQLKTAIPTFQNNSRRGR